MTDKKTNRKTARGTSLSTVKAKGITGGVDVHAPRVEIARQLKEVRKSKGITQEYLAEQIGTKKSNISRFESGRYNPSLDFLVKLAGGLGKEIQVKVK